MQLIRLLSTKADVVRVLIKRSESASSSSSSSSTPSFSLSSSFCDKSSSTAAEFISTHRRGGSSSSLFGFFKDRTQQSSSPPPPAHAYHGRRRSSFQVLEEASNGDRMYPDTALYLGDVQGKLSYLFCCAYVTILTKKAKFHCRPLDNYASESRPLRNRACTCTFQLPCSDLDTTVTNFQFDQPCYWKIDRVCYYFVTNESYYWSLGWVYLSFYFFLSFLWRIKTAVVTLHNRYERKSSWQRLRRSVVLFLDRFWASCICRVCVHSRT